MAGTNLYDVMYHQHFLGSHKLIPLPAVGEYVRERARKGSIIRNDSSGFNLKLFDECTMIFLLEKTH